MSIKKKATADTIVGLFVFLGIVAINLITFVIREDLFGGTNSFRVRFDSVSGLEVGAPVLVSGVRAGRVTSIGYEPRPILVNGQNMELPVIVSIVVDDKFPVYSNARVRLVQQGFVGDKRVEIDPGNAELGKPVSKDSPPLTGEPQFDIGKIIGQAESIVSDMQETVSGFREFVTNDRNLNAIGETIQNLNTSVEKIHDYLIANENNVRETLANLRVISEDMKVLSANAVRFTEEGGDADQLVEEIQATLAELRREMNELTDRGTDTLQTANATIQNLDYRTERLTNSGVAFLDGTKEDFSALSRNLQQTSANLDKLISSVREGEGTVGRLITDPAPFEDLKASIQALHLFIVGEHSRYENVNVPYEFAPAESGTGSWYEGAENPGAGNDQ